MSDSTTGFLPRPGEAAPDASRVFIVKLAGACNLNCTYCYVYNLGDTTFQKRPRIMSREVAAAAIRRIFQYVAEKGLDRIAVSLHGGEALLVGQAWMKWFLGEIRGQTPDGLGLDIAVQTNGTLLDRQWVELFEEHQVGIGISIDGPAEWHDRFRVNFKGRGSYAEVRRAIDLMAARGRESDGWGVLVVVNPEYRGTAIYSHLREIGVQNMDFLWPGYNHDNPPPWPRGALAKYYIDLFNLWYGEDNPAVQIRFFVNAIRMFLGQNTQVDALGIQPLTEVVIEADGSIEPLDMLRSCENGITNLGLNVLTDRIEAIYQTEIFQWCLRNQALLPPECHRCSVYDVCGGGYMPNRWGKQRKFANRSVHCYDLLEVLTHIRARIGPDLERLREETPGLACGFRQEAGK